MVILSQFADNTDISQLKRVEITIMDVSDETYAWMQKESPSILRIPHPLSSASICTWSSEEVKLETKTAFSNALLSRRLLSKASTT